MEVVDHRTTSEQPLTEHPCLKESVSVHSSIVYFQGIKLIHFFTSTSVKFQQLKSQLTVNLVKTSCYVLGFKFFIKKSKLMRIFHLKKLCA